MFEPTAIYVLNPHRYDTMTYNRAGTSGLKLPAVSLGFWHNFGDITPFDQMKSLVFTAFDNGITHFDLANNYGPEPGQAEKNCGLLLAKYFKHHRDELVISTKAGYEMWTGLTTKRETFRTPPFLSLRPALRRQRRTMMSSGFMPLGTSTQENVLLFWRPAASPALSPNPQK